jgi:hypothetical protein
LYPAPSEQTYTMHNEWRDQCMALSNQSTDAMSEGEKNSRKKQKGNIQHIIPIALYDDKSWQYFEVIHDKYCTGMLKVCELFQILISPSGTSCGISRIHERHMFVCTDGCIYTSFLFFPHIDMRSSYRYIHYLRLHKNSYCLSCAHKHNFFYSLFVCVV